MVVGEAETSVQDRLARVLVKVSRSHWLLSGIVAAAVHPDVRSNAEESLEVLAEAISELRELAVDLQTSAAE